MFLSAKTLCVLWGHLVWIVNTGFPSASGVYWEAGVRVLVVLVLPEPSSTHSSLKPACRPKLHFSSCWWSRWACWLGKCGSQMKNKALYLLPKCLFSFLLCSKDCLIFLLALMRLNPKRVADLYINSMILMWILHVSFSVSLNTHFGSDLYPTTTATSSCWFLHLHYLSGQTGRHNM